VKLLSDLVYDWNTAQMYPSGKMAQVQLYDETLRDGIQGPSVVDPSIEQKQRIIQLEAELGIHWVNLGLPAASVRARAHVEALAQFLAKSNFSIRPSCAARALVEDIRPIAEISQRMSIELEVMSFLGTSQIRQYAEGWDLNHLLKLSDQAIQFAQKENLPITLVSEDSTRSSPETLRPFFLNAIQQGVSRICLCDTVGHATPTGVQALISWVQELILGQGLEVSIDWHGHNDRGLGVSNALSAAEAGAQRIHGTALGIGERAGNAALDQILLNLSLMGIFKPDLRALVPWCRLVAESSQVSIPHSYPLVGRDAFRTSAGVHAAAVIKAQRKGDDWLADRIYSAVPAQNFGRRQAIEIGHMSGLAAVEYWLSEHGFEASPSLCRYILAEAKTHNRVLNHEELLSLIHSWNWI